MSRKSGRGGKNRSHGRQAEFRTIRSSGVSVTGSVRSSVSGKILRLVGLDKNCFLREFLGVGRITSNSIS